MTRFLVTQNLLFFQSRVNIRQTVLILIFLVQPESPWKTRTLFAGSTNHCGAEGTDAALTGCGGWAREPSQILCTQFLFIQEELLES